MCSLLENLQKIPTQFEQQAPTRRREMENFFWLFFHLNTCKFRANPNTQVIYLLPTGEQMSCTKLEQSHAFGFGLCCIRLDSVRFGSVELWPKIFLENIRNFVGLKFAQTQFIWSRKLRKHGENWRAWPWPVAGRHNKIINRPAAVCGQLRPRVGQSRLRSALIDLIGFIIEACVRISPDRARNSFV